MIGRVENCSGSGKGFIRRPAIASETVDSLEGRRNNRQINPRVFHGLTMKSPSFPHTSFFWTLCAGPNKSDSFFVFFFRFGFPSLEDDRHFSFPLFDLILFIFIYFLLLIGQPGWPLLVVKRERK
ncbi:hypothetical protein OUZ56_006906 [Daphnia magna]|uniref:Uncharacterized protein n=1 Tax=Daphnia magna TaxID=35525 RepID=A0ABQ9YY98_9CRUS|nr:hypothetical protein OUZ56_006906 [Daphnia magna]